MIKNIVNNNNNGMDRDRENVVSLTEFMGGYMNTSPSIDDIRARLFGENGKVLDFSQPVVAGKFYRMGMDEIVRRTSQNYIDFLKEAGYIEGSPRYLEVNEDLLKINKSVKEIAGKIKIEIKAEKKDGDYFLEANQCDARTIIGALGGRLLTAGLMYKVFIPFLNALSKKDDVGAKKTLRRMRSSIYSEFLEDVVLGNKKAVICNGERILSFPEKYGNFNLSDLDEYGYPSQTREFDGAFPYHPAENPESAVLRCYKLGLNLKHNIYFGSFFTGMRFARFV